MGIFFASLADFCPGRLEQLACTAHARDALLLQDAVTDLRTDVVCRCLCLCPWAFALPGIDFPFLISSLFLLGCHLHAHCLAYTVIARLFDGWNSRAETEIQCCRSRCESHLED